MENRVTNTVNFRQSLMLEGQQVEGVHFKGDVGFIAHSSKIDLRYWTRINTPCRTRDWQVSYVRDGVCHNIINLLDDTTVEGDLQIVPPGILVMPLENEPTLNISVVSISNESLTHSYKQKMPVTLHLDAEQRSIVENYLNLVNQLAQADDAHEQVLASVVDSLIGYALGLASDRENDEVKLTHHQQLFRRFHLLLTQHGVNEHKIAFYAHRLAITPNYLNHIIKEVSGQTVTEWINQLLVSEARAALSYSNMSIQDIAYALNFPNVPFFCKFFKNHTGMRPTQYRKQG